MKTSNPKRKTYFNGKANYQAPTNGNGSLSKGWLLSILVGVMIMVGGWWASSTNVRISSVSDTLNRKGEDIAELRTNVSYIKDDMKEVKKDIKDIRDLLMQQKGLK